MAVSPATRRTSTKERSRARIIAAATRLIAERGLDSLSFADIAEAAGISRPLIYFHFKDRDQLFHETVVRANKMLLARFEKAVAAHTTGLDQIVAVGRAYQAFFEENPREFALISCYEAKPANPARPSATEAKIISCHEAIMSLMSAVLTRGIRDGSLRKNLGDPLKTALCLWAFTHGLLQVTATGGAGIEETHGVKPGALIDFGFNLLQSVLEKR
jgi:AcrR family transcriptional regulator